MSPPKYGVLNHKFYAFDTQYVGHLVGVGADVESFFANAPQINRDTDKIMGKVCGVRVETVADPTMKNIRRLDKLVDELGKGKIMEKVLRL